MVEEEIDGQMPFLYVLVNRTFSDLRKSLYRKPTHTKKHLNFNSAHPIRQKQSLVAASYSTAFDHVCSSHTKPTEEL